MITWRGQDHPVSDPVIVGRETALPAFPRYERQALQAIGINEFVWIHDPPASPKAASPAHSSNARDDVMTSAVGWTGRHQAERCVE